MQDTVENPNIQGSRYLACGCCSKSEDFFNGALRLWHSQVVCTPRAARMKLLRKIQRQPRDPNRTNVLSMFLGLVTAVAYLMQGQPQVSSPVYSLCVTL